MSQHRFNYGKFEILAGWDRPLQQFFLVVDVVDVVDVVNAEGDDPIYSNLFDSSAVGLKGCSYFQVKLAELGVTAPPGFWAAIESDRDCNKGPGVRFWSVET